MSMELINIAIANDADFWVSMSGGKDSEATALTLRANNIRIAGGVHADLGRLEHKESGDQCQQLAAELGIPLVVVRRTDGADMLTHWRNRMLKLKSQGKINVGGKTTPFWSSSGARYCTSDMKREPINKHFRSVKNNLIVSCEGIRADEGDARKFKSPIAVRWAITSEYYMKFAGVAVRVKQIKKLNDSAKAMKSSNPLKAKKYSQIAVLEREVLEIVLPVYNPKKRLAITWFPIFNFTTDEVWATRGHTSADLQAARIEFKQTGKANDWRFHPAYAKGNNRVSCVFCVMGCSNDLAVGAKHYPELLKEMIALEKEGNATFKDGESLERYL